MKYVVVTGGVISGLGKGITISSLGALLRAGGQVVTSIKIVSIGTVTCVLHCVTNSEGVLNMHTYKFTFGETTGPILGMSSAAVAAYCTARHTHLTHPLLVSSAPTSPHLTPSPPQHHLCNIRTLTRAVSNVRKTTLHYLHMTSQTSTCIALRCLVCAPHSFEPNGTWRVLCFGLWLRR